MSGGGGEVVPGGPPPKEWGACEKCGHDAADHGGVAGDCTHGFSMDTRVPLVMCKCMRFRAPPDIELGEALASCKARVTFDRRRSIALPCWLCETTATPRGLVAIGTYTRAMGGNIQAGDPIMRPLCAGCDARTA